MASVTGIELGPDYCVLVKARMRAGTIEIGAVRVVESGEWPRDLAGRAAFLAQVRRTHAFPKRAWIVAWNVGNSTPALPSAGARDAETILAGAGFQTEAVLSPTQALALLGGSRQPMAGGPDTALWLAINQHGTALAIVRGFENLYAREFAWRITAPEQRAQAHLLRRYLMVAQLTPEIRRGIQTVRTQHGIDVDFAMVCGTIGDLRSLTMALIAELDIELETLDSAAGLQATGAAAAVVAERAPAVHLAWVTAAAGAARGRDTFLRRWFGAAAVTALAIGAAGWALDYWADSTRRVATASTTAGRASESLRPDSPAPVEPIPPDRAPAPPPRRDVEPRGVGSMGSPQATTGLVKPAAARVASAPKPLELPLPDVSGILISAERRLAIIDGTVVSPGDRVGGRVVVRIEPNAVVLREPSGSEIRVGVRGKRP